MNGNSTGILPPLPPQLNDLLMWLFGAGFWVWLIAVGAVLAIYVSKRGFRKEVVKDESKSVSMPTTKEYLEGGKEEQSAEAKKEYFCRVCNLRHSFGSKIGKEHDPTVLKGISPKQEEKKEMVAFPNWPKDVDGGQAITNAFEDVKKRMVEEFVDAIKRLEIKITLPERNDPDKILNVTLPEKLPEAEE